MVKPIDKTNELPESTAVAQPQDQAAAPAETPQPTPASRGFISSGILKGLAVTALVIVGVMALVAGSMGMGSPGNLSVDGTLMTNFEQGAYEGLKTGLSFLTTNLGLASLAVGAAFGVAREHKIVQKEAAAGPDSEEHTKVLALTQELELQKSINQELVDAKANAVATPETQAQAPAAADQKPVVLANNEANKPAEKTEGIHIAGSIIADNNFRASELKRRVERVASAEVKAM